MFSVRTFDPKTISWWHMEKDQIDFEPPYQRKGKLWSDRDKSFLIDSVINRFDIPKIYLADFTFGNNKSFDLNPSKKSYAIIDGKQRFEALFDFIDNKVTLNQDFVYLDEPSIALGGLSYKDLKANYPRIASKFDNFPLSVMSVITDQEGMINELFVRLNNSKPLTGSELRNAMKGIVPRLIKNISSLEFFKTKIKFATSRAQDANAAAKLLLLEFRGKFVDTKKIDLDRFVVEAQEAETSNFESAASRVEKVVALMNDAFTEKDVLLKSSGVLPAYYWLFKQNALQYQKIRPFLQDFERDRTGFIKRNKAAAYQDDAPTINQLTNSLNFEAGDIHVDIDAFYRAYQSYLRNPNDQSGIQGVFQILDGLFLVYLLRNNALTNNKSSKSAPEIT